MSGTDRARSPKWNRAAVDDAVARYRAASEANDIGALLETLAPDVELVSPLSGRLVFRGRGLHVLAAGGFQQYRTLSLDCLNHPAYHGANYSAGDTFISECAAGRGGTGNTTTWRFVGANQHMVFVASAVAATI